MATTEKLRKCKRCKHKKEMSNFSPEGFVCFPCKLEGYKRSE